MAVHASHAALPYPIKNARFSFLVPYLDADGDPTDPTTPDTEISEDGAAFTDCAEEVTTISGSNGVGLMTLSGAETDCSAAAIAAKVASGPKATLMTFYPRQLVSIGTGTLSAGSAGGGTLGTVLAYDVTGCFIKTTGGTGGGGTGGADNQVRKIMTYNTSTGAFTVEPNWETTVSTDTTYDVLLPEGVTLGMLRAVNPTTAGRTIDVTAGGTVGIDWANVESPSSTVDLSDTSINLCDTVTTLTGHTAQTGDSFARIGATGSGLTSLAQASVATEARLAELDAGNLPADVDTLLSRITSTLFSGITSLAEWLGLIAGKQTGDATARTEIRATGGGSGTYDETTDSQEAIRDHIGDGTNLTEAGGDGDHLTEAGGTGDQLTGIPDMATATNQTNIELDTQDIQSRLPAALVSGKMDSDATSISGDSTAADRLEGMMDGVIVAQVNDASATTTDFAADGFTEATDDHFNGRLITFISGALTGQQTDITDYDAAGGAQGSQQFTVTALTEAPANEDFFVIH